MNILGEGFPPEIIKQVEIRQKRQGSGYDTNSLRSPEEVIYLNSKNAWCKLVSSADITDVDILNNTNIKGLNYTQDQLARNFILFNGTTPSGSLGKSGLGYGNNRGLGAYNTWGISNADWGFRPMAGITSVNVKHLNRGSIRKAVVNIKANDKITFEIVDVLYLRLGFSVLLEWGNSVYFGNNNQLVTNPDNSLANDFLDGKVTYVDFLKKIKDQTIKSNGNYDAMFGKVTNFHWSFLPDGTYDITLDLVSVGDVVESFKVKGNALTSNSTSLKSNKISSNDQTQNTFDFIKLYAPTSDIANYLYRMANLFNITWAQNFLVNYSYKSDDNNYWGQFGEFRQAINSGKYTADATIVKSSNGDHYFIRLGNLIQFIEQAIMYKVKSTGGEKPILNFSYDPDTNFMHVPPQLMSYDPSICMVRRTVEFPSSNPPSSIPLSSATNAPTQQINFVTGQPIPNNYVQSPSLISIPTREYFYLTTYGVTPNNYIEKFMVDGLPEVGKIMNIYINFKFIINKLQELINTDTNELKLIDFLKEILSGINSAFGGYSKLDLFIDETSNTVKIIDQNPLPSIKQALNYVNTQYANIGSSIKIPTEYALFDLYGYNSTTNAAGFIRDFKFNTELTPEFSTMIAVSATSNGNVVGENNTALSRLNLGLKDRFKEEVNGGGALLNASGQTELQRLTGNLDIARNEYNNFMLNLKGYLDNLYENTYIESEIQDNKSFLTIFFKLYKKYKKAESDLNNYLSKTNNPTAPITKFQPGTGFIPFNLSLTMDGISGVKIGSKFLIDGRYLPSNYPQTVDFLIKTVSHEIKNNQWTTTLESYCIAQGDNEYKSPSQVTSNPSNSQLYKGQTKLSEADTTSFLTDVLKGLGIPSPNPLQIRFMKNWRQAEGGNAAWNPLNSTLSRPGSKPNNTNIDPNTGRDFPVQNYTNRAQGIDATVATIKGSRYTQIVNSIKNIKVAQDINKAMIAVNNSPWGTKFNPPDYNRWVTLSNFIYSDPIIPK